MGSVCARTNSIFFLWQRQKVLPHSDNLVRNDAILVKSNSIFHTSEADSLSQISAMGMCEEVGEMESDGVIASGAAGRRGDAR
mmetsp:Transcript_5179/g.10408  ORF Transcript_5179/g.10408 Transcript_5179/m.10408 type:complete len:83 (+) Transcript_5179:161-409(+)